MTDEEWQLFGDRFPSEYKKIKLLGRGGFALVWLGQDKQTKEQLAIKQICSNNMHQTHMKEIWFQNQIFENGQPKQMYQNKKGISNLIKLKGYQLQEIDTWLFYELGGDSLGSTLYDLKIDNKSSDGERYFKIIYKDFYLQMKNDISFLKRIIYDLAQALQILQEQNIVHSDLKTENILIKAKLNKKNSIQIQEVKLIDYGSAFIFGNLKNFSMATPEYMAPEILNYILDTNKLQSNKQLLEYLKDYNKSHVIDIWSLGCVILEIVNGIPLWMSYQTKIQFQGQEVIKCGLFAVKNRIFENIIQKQVQAINSIDNILSEQNYSGIVVDQTLKVLIKRMLCINPSQRISPQEIINILNPEFQ